MCKHLIGTPYQSTLWHPYHLYEVPFKIKGGINQPKGEADGFSGTGASQMRRALPPLGNLVFFKGKD